MSDDYNEKHEDFLEFNEVVYPPLRDGESIRPAVHIFPKWSLCISYIWAIQGKNGTCHKFIILRN